MVDSSTEKLYAGLLSVGDEILEVNGEKVACLSLDQVTHLLTQNASATVRVLRHLRMIPRWPEYHLTSITSQTNVPEFSLITKLHLWHVVQTEVWLQDNLKQSEPSWKWALMQILQKLQWANELTITWGTPQISWSNQNQVAQQHTLTFHSNPIPDILPKLGN